MHAAVEGGRAMSVGRHAGAVFWLTGLSGAGKSTIATLAQADLAARGYSACVLDGDALRKGLSSDLGYSLADHWRSAKGAIPRACMGKQGPLAFRACRGSISA